jgi:iron complex transport system ATP-binding protein
MRLEASGVVVRAGGRRIVDGASLTVAPGELVGLIGPNGAGKSTLLRAIVGVRGCDAGDVRLDGLPVESLTPRERARRIAYLPQERRVEWRLPARDVVMLGRFPHREGFGGPTLASRAAVDRALARVEAEVFAARPVSSLSEGERARVLLARALAVEAPVLLADEPTAALDPYHQLQVMEILQEEARAGAAVLAVLHDLVLAARFMDRLVLMHDGRVVVEGPPEKVLDAESVSDVYRIAVIPGAHEGRSWVIPWSRRS